MADIRDSKNWGFETKQLHIGQEKADPVTDARAVPIYRRIHLFFSLFLSFNPLCQIIEIHPAIHLLFKD